MICNMSFVIDIICHTFLIIKTENLINYFQSIIRYYLIKLSCFLKSRFQIIRRGIIFCTISDYDYYMIPVF